MNFKEALAIAHARRVSQEDADEQERLETIVESVSPVDYDHAVFYTLFCRSLSDADIAEAHAEPVSRINGKWVMMEDE